MPIKINGTNTAANPSITGSDTDTGIVYGSDQIDFSTGGSSKVTLNGSDLGIGTTSPDRTIHCHNSSNTTNVRAKFSNGTTGDGASDGFEIGINASDPAQAVLVNYEASPIAFFTGGTERIRVDESGNIRSPFVDGSTGLRQKIQFVTESPHFDEVGYIAMNRTAVSSAPSDMVFATGTAGSTSERMRIVNDGRVRILCESFASDPSSSNKGVMLGSTNTGSVFSSGSATNAQTHIIFRNGNGDVGTIQTSGSSTIYNTSSDYRLKENAVAISDGITRLKTLKPYRFNFKADADTTVDGFFAHEVTAVPEAISGTKDETKDILYTEEDTIPSGKKVGDVKETIPVYQGIDQSKIVPLLTAALQEAVGKIEVLETKVAALEAA